MKLNLINLRKDILTLIFEFKDENGIDIPYDIFIMIFFSFINIFLCIFLSFINNTKIRLHYSLIFGLIIQYFVYGERIVDTLITDLFITILIAILPTELKKNYLGLIIVIITFSHMSYLHIERFYIDFGKWSFDHHILYMMSLPRYILFGYYYQDNAFNNNPENNEELSKRVKNDNDKQSIDQFEYSTIDFLSYIHSIPICIIGPVVSYQKYINFIYLRNEYSQIKIYYLEILKKVFNFVLISVIYSKTEKMIHADNIKIMYDELDFSNKSISMVSNENLNVTVNMILPYISFIIVFWSKIFNKIKYLSGFMISEIICDISGQSFESDYYAKLNENKVIRHVDILKVETNFNVEIFFQYWNISIHYWLKESFYKRSIKYTGSKSISNTLTFIISAIWHGFYLSYYVGFGIIIIIQFVQREINKLKSCINSSNSHLSKILYYIFIYIPYMICFLCCYAYIGITMDLLDYKKLISWTIHFSFMPFIALFILVILGIFSKFIHKFQKNDDKKEKKDKIK